MLGNDRWSAEFMATTDAAPPYDGGPDEAPKGKGGGKSRPTTTDNLSDLVNPTTYEGSEPPEREFVVEGWLAKGTVTSLVGPGGGGKTLLAQQLQIATAAGKSWLGMPTNQCKSLAFYCEDDADELHRRCRAICHHYDIFPRNLGLARWQGRFGLQNLMMTFDGSAGETTSFFDFIAKAMQVTEAELLILDNVAQLFGGNENDRSAATQFVNALGRIAVNFNVAVLLLAHPGKSETGLTSQYSGSTAWDAAVRCRWLLSRLKPENGQSAKELSDYRALTKMKANYSSIGDEITLKWTGGAFATESTATAADAVSRIEAATQEREDDARFLDALDALTNQGRATSPTKTATNYAPKLIAATPQWSGIPRAASRAVAAMERLFAAGTIRAGVQIGTKGNRHPLIGIGRQEVVS